MYYLRSDSRKSFAAVKRMSPCITAIAAAPSVFNTAVSLPVIKWIAHWVPSKRFMLLKIDDSTIKFA